MRGPGAMAVCFGDSRLVVRSRLTQCKQRFPREKSARTRGAIVVEFLLAFPVALIFLLAIVEFGIILANLEQVEMAAYEGAKTAARMDRDHIPHAIDHLEYRVNRSLNTSRIGPACGVEFRHNIPDASHRKQHRWRHHRRDLRHKPLPENKNVAAVQCTVCVPLSQLGPDLLPFVGFSLRKRYATATKTLPYLR